MPSRVSVSTPRAGDEDAQSGPERQRHRQITQDPADEQAALVVALRHTPASNRRDPGQSLKQRTTHGQPHQGERTLIGSVRGVFPTPIRTPEQTNAGNNAEILSSRNGSDANGRLNRMGQLSRQDMLVPNGVRRHQRTRARVLAFGRRAGGEGSTPGRLTAHRHWRETEGALLRPDLTGADCRTSPSPVG